MAVTVSLINMKGGVGKTTLAFNLAWYAAWRADLRVLAVDIDPQSNLSQYFMGAEQYRAFLEGGNSTVVEVFEQFSPPKSGNAAPTPLNPDDLVHRLREWQDEGQLDLLPSRLELAWTLKNPTEKAHLLPRFLSTVSSRYDLILIDCPPTESILTTAAYLSSRYVAVPVRPEFLATIGLPLLARSLDEFKVMHQDQDLEMAGIIFNDLRRTNPPPAQRQSCADVEAVAKQHNWPVFQEVAHHSDSYPSGALQGTPIFFTPHARDYVAGEFSQVAKKFLQEVGAI